MIAYSEATDPAIRRSGIGASDVPAIMRMSPFTSDYDVYLEKRGEGTRIFTPEQQESLEWGQILEAPVRERYARKTGLQIVPVHETIRHAQFPFVMVHPDGRIVDHNEGYEGKTTAFHAGKHWEVEDSDDIPPHVWIQDQACMELTGWDAIHTVVLVGGNRMKPFVVRRDPVMGQQIVEICVRFWRDHVLAGVPPKAITEDDVLRRFPQSKVVAKAADAPTLQAYHEWQTWTRTESEAKVQAQKQRDIIATYLGECNALTVGKKTVLTYNTQKTNGGWDRERFQFDYPGVWERYKKSAGTTRVMRDKGL